MRLFRHDVITASPCRRVPTAPSVERRPASWRRLPIAAVLALALPGVSHGLGLGRAVGEPVLGESLLIEVPVTGSIERPLDADCVSLRRPPDSIDSDYFPRDISARVDRQGGSTRLVVTTRSAIRQPLVEFRVSVTCGYNLSSDFLLMASPRKEVTVQSASLAPQASQAQAQPTTPAQSATRAPAPSAMDGSLPDGIAGRNIVIEKNMTLEQLAKKHFPGPLRQGRFMRWVAEANPQLFAGEKPSRQHKLQAGQQLVIPDGVPPRRPGDHRNGQTPLGEPMPQARGDAAAAAPGVPARPAARKSGDEPAPTRQPAEGRKDRLVVGSGGGARDARETAGLVERLTGMMEQQLATQAANDEKIKQLEATVAELGQVIARMQKEAAQREARWQAERQAEKQAERAARDREEERGWWQLLMAVGVGGILGAGVLQGLRVLGGRKKDEGAAELDTLPTTSTPESSAPFPEPPAPRRADKDSQPLTEFGWGDEAATNAKAASGTPAAALKPAMPATAAVVPAVVAPPPAPAPAAADSGLEFRPARSSEPPAISFEPPAASPAAPASAATSMAELPNDPAKAAIELANIMTSMGLADSAAQTLVEHIRENPRQSLGQWLKLLEIYRLKGDRTEFEKYSQEMRQHFNVQPDEWTRGSATGRASLEDYPHIRAQIVRLWRQPEAPTILQALLLDNRGGTRAGFPLAVAEEILLLMSILDDSTS